MREFEGVLVESAKKAEELDCPSFNGGQTNLKRIFQASLDIQ